MCWTPTPNRYIPSFLCHCQHFIMLTSFHLCLLTQILYEWPILGTGRFCLKPNALERHSGTRKFKPGVFWLQNYWIFTAGTYLLGLSKLATFAIVIRFKFRSFKLHIFTIINSQCRMLLQNFAKLKKKHEIMLNTFTRSLIIWEPAIKHGPMKLMGGLGMSWEPGELNSSPTLEIPLLFTFGNKQSWQQPVIVASSFSSCVLLWH